MCKFEIKDAELAAGAGTPTLAVNGRRIKRNKRGWLICSECSPFV